MSTFLSFLKSLFFGAPPQLEIDEAYLAGSSDIYDLERRMREIDLRGHNAAYGVTLGLYTR